MAKQFPKAPPLKPREVDFDPKADALLVTTSDIGKALRQLFPDADPLRDYTTTHHDGEFRLMAWNLPDPIPTVDEITAAAGNFANNWNATAYRRERAAEYPTIGDQLDAIWKLLDPPQGSEAASMKAKIAAIKAKYPKPTA